MTSGADLVRRAAAVDVHYPAAGGATGAVVVADDERFAAIIEERVAHVPQVDRYEPGALYRRELPAILAALAGIVPVGLLVVDGYATLSPEGRPGLGAHAHAALGVPVIGVAKTAFRGAGHAIPVTRPPARRPLFVTAVGVPAERAAAMVAAMAGRYRLPDALRRVDALSRAPRPAPG
jgi:deoxyribonuclease V